MGSMKNHGLSVVDFRRSIIPSDEHDAPIPLEGPTQVSSNLRFAFAFKLKKSLSLATRISYSSKFELELVFVFSKIILWVWLLDGSTTTPVSLGSI